jgi:hypothetical protein
VNAQQHLWEEAGWPSVIEEENKQAKKLEQEIRADESSIRMMDSFLQMSQSGAYKIFQEELAKMQMVQFAKAMNASTDREATLRLGRSAQCSEIYDLVVNFSQRRETLAKALALKQDELVQIRNPNQRPEEPS